jgi:hypothetical protein
MANKISKNFMGKALKRTIDALNPARPIIYGKLKVAAGHDYWWFLEFGTGSHRDADLPIDDQGIAINPPDAVANYSPDAQGPYDIVAKEKPLLVYIVQGHGHAQRIFYRKETVHPGIRPIGIVRTALFSAHLYLKEQIDTRTEGRRRKSWKLPTRKELVEMVNEALEELLLQLQASTPSGDANDPNPYHHGRHPIPLAQAWKVTKAR